MWSEDSGSYWCQAETVTHSLEVQGSNVSLDTQAPGGQETEGGDLTLLCSRGHRNQSGTEAQHSLSADLEIPAVKEHNAGQYYYRADNGHNPIQNKVVNISVRIPTSCPVLTLRGARAQAVMGDMVELCCLELLLHPPPPPILYRFYHEDINLGSSSAPSGEGASFNLSLTAGHSGSYSCEADNGLGAQFSELVPLPISGGLMVPGYRSSIIVNGFLL
eukprot:bmy_15527T0